MTKKRTGALLDHRRKGGIDVAFAARVQDQYLPPDRMGGSLDPFRICLCFSIWIR